MRRGRWISLFLAGCLILTSSLTVLAAAEETSFSEGQEVSSCVSEEGTPGESEEEASATEESKEETEASGEEEETESEASEPEEAEKPGEKEGVTEESSKEEEITFRGETTFSEEATGTEFVGEQKIEHQLSQVRRDEPLAYKWVTLGGESVKVGNSADLYYAVNKKANVTVQIFYGNNNYLKTLVSNRETWTNDQVAIWDLTDNAGNYVPNGTYRFTVIAATDSGEQVIEHRWFQVSGNEPLAYKWVTLGGESVKVGDSAHLYYAVNKKANVTVQIFYGNNNYLKTLVSDQETWTNDQVAIWDLTDNAGNYVPDGTYRFTVIATTAGGETVIAHKWFQVGSPATVGARQVLNTVGWDLRAAYNWSVNIPYYRMNFGPPAGNSHVEWYGNYGFQNGKGNCYVKAATFCCMARLLGYETYLVEGQVPLRSGGMGPHGWCEIIVNGTTYICDPEFESGNRRNGYMITYGASGTYQYSNYGRVE